MKEYFKEQLKDNKVITEEQLKKLKGESLYSNYQIGDKVLCFLLQEFEGNDPIPTVRLTMKTITERELDKFSKDENYKYQRTSSEIPIFEKVRI